jgi:hypothetical protein
VQIFFFFFFFFVNACVRAMRWHHSGVPLPLHTYWTRVGPPEVAVSIHTESYKWQGSEGRSHHLNIGMGLPDHGCQ